MTTEIYAFNYKRMSSWWLINENLNLNKYLKYLKSLKSYSVKKIL